MSKDGLKRNVIERSKALSKDIEEIRQMIDDGDDLDAVSRFQRDSLKAVLELLPIAQAQYKKNPTMSNAYALNSIISQVRELVNDMESAREQAQLVDSILDTYVRPTFLNIASYLLNSSTILRSELSPLYSGKQASRDAKACMDRFIREAARYLEDAHNKLREDISNGLE
jgi:hypothetical protein